MQSHKRNCRDRRRLADHYILSDHASAPDVEQNHLVVAHVRKFPLPLVPHAIGRCQRGCRFPFGACMRSGFVVILQDQLGAATTVGARRNDGEAPDINMAPVVVPPGRVLFDEIESAGCQRGCAIAEAYVISAR